MDLHTFDPQLTWEVQESPVFSADGQRINGYKVLSNSDTGETLQVCKDSYTPTRNEQFIEAVETLQDQTGFSLEGFASFKGGRKVMAYLKNNDPINPLGLNLGEHFVIGNSHDGSTAFFMGMTTRIYRCSNMFTQQNMQARVYHRADQEHRVKQAVNTVNLYYDQQREMYTTWEDLASKPAERADLRKVIDSGLLGIERQEELNGISTRKANIRERLYEAAGTELEDLGSNLFGLFNGVTRYTSNVMKQKQPLYGNPFGRAAEMNQKAYSICQDIAKERNRRTTINIPSPDLI